MVLILIAIEQSCSDSKYELGHKPHITLTTMQFQNISFSFLWHTNMYMLSRCPIYDIPKYTWYKDIDVFTKSRIMCFTISPMSIFLWCGWCKSSFLPIFFAHFSYFRGLFMYGHITDWVIGGYVGPSVWSYWCFYIVAQHSGLLCVPTPDPLNTSQHNTSANNTYGSWTIIHQREVQYTIQYSMAWSWTKAGEGRLHLPLLLFLLT